MRELRPADANGSRPCIAFTGGGTGGHIYPGLAVIEAMRVLGFKGRIIWIGSEKELDRNIVEEHDIEFLAIPSGKCRREISLRNLTDISRIVAGYFKAKAILNEIQPSLLFSKGGYVSVPPCRAAARLGIPVITHESDASPGLATRLNSAKASTIMTSWNETASYFPPKTREKVLRTGNPIRPSLFRGDRARGLAHLGFNTDRPVVFVLGGSQGAKEVNDIVLSALPLLLPEVQIVHQTGAVHFDDVLARVPRESMIKSAYRPLPYIGAEIADIYAASDIVAGRAGAGTLWEAASLGKPMVLIPLAGAGTRGDQVENAALAAKSGAAIVLTNAALSPESFAQAVRHMLSPATMKAALRACSELTKISLSTLPGTSRESVEDAAIPSAEFIARFLLKKLEKQAKEAK